MQPTLFYALPDLGVLRIEGADAAAFLHGQLTADMRDLPAGTATLAGWCSPQGRVIALPRVGPVATGFLAVLPRELCQPVGERMRRFVMRSKVVISDASAEIAVAGISGDGPDLLEQAGRADDGIIRFRLPSSRTLLLGSPAKLARAGGELASGSAEAWEARCIAEGEPEVYARTSESWIPQMLNLDLLGAVSFSKGCYPGQEIVARTQHLGRIKRRLLRYLVSGPELPAAGDGLFLEQDKVGEVVRLIRHADAAQLLAVVNLDATGLGLTTESRRVTCSPAPMRYEVPGVGGS